MNKLIKKLFGIDKIEAEVAEVTRLKIEAEAAAAQASKLAEEAIEKQRLEPWVAVLDTHVNKENMRNGFFELDWNEYFVLQLRSAGYKGNSDEEIVDQWFSELCQNLGSESGIDMSRRGSGYVNKALRDDGKTEIG
jgi:hypothetical protein